MTFNSPPVRKRGKGRSPTRHAVFSGAVRNYTGPEGPKLYWAPEPGILFCPVHTGAPSSQRKLFRVNIRFCMIAGITVRLKFPAGWSRYFSFPHFSHSPLEVVTFCFPSESNFPTGTSLPPTTRKDRFKQDFFFPLASPLKLVYQTHSPPRLFFFSLRVK